MRRTLFLFLTLCLCPVVAHAQIANPTTVEFTMSTDHSTVANNVQVLTSYKVNVYAAAGTALLGSADIGKPAPDANNLIRWANLPTLYATLPVGQYVVKVAAVGPGGEVESPTASDPFSVTVRPPAAPIGKPIIR